MIKLYDMKKLLVLLVMLAFSTSVTAVAVARERQTWDSQPYRYEIRIGWGMPSYTSSDAYHSTPAYSSAGILASI